MTRVAAVDCGTNTVKLLVADLDRESGSRGELGAGLDSEPGNDHVGLEYAAVLGRDACVAAGVFDPRHRRVGE